MDELSSQTIDERIVFSALDGYQLGGILYRPIESVTPPRVIVFNAGGGVAAARYRRFARFLAASGIPTFTYDYRGIANSRPPDLRGFAAVLEDWTEHDCGGAISWLGSRYPQAEMIGVAHSVGTLLFGGAPNASQLTRFVMICPHTGYFGDYRAGYRLPMAMLWHGIMPVLTRLFGYFPAKLLGLGDDIPSGIALQWAARRTPHLRPESTDPSGTRGQLALARCLALSGRALALTVSDDAFATGVGAQRLLSNFPKLQAARWLVSPEQAGVRRLGHFGVFRASAHSYIWTRLLAYVVHGELPLAASFARDSYGDRTYPPLADTRGHAEQSQSGIADDSVRGNPH